jgi:hypothetical protein
MSTSRSPLLLTSGLLLILVLWTSFLPIVVASSTPVLFRQGLILPIRKAERLSSARASVEQPSPAAYNISNYQSLWSNCGGKLPFTAIAYDLWVSVRSGNVFSWFRRYQLDINLQSAVLIENGTNYRQTGGFETLLMQPESFPLPKGRDVVLSEQFLLTFPPPGSSYHASFTWQFVDADFNVVGCTNEQYDLTAVRM